MLLSLPSPNVLCVKEINNTFSEFLWSGKPPKWRKEILEGEVHHGVLELHNIVLFDKTLKLSWLRRYLRSRGKCTIFPNEFDMSKVFTFGVDCLEKISEEIRNKFWKDVIKSLSYRWNTDAALGQDLINNTPIWLNPNIGLPIRACSDSRVV